MDNRDNTLKFAVRAFGPFESALEKVWKAYCEETGCLLQLEAVPMELPELHKTILENEGLKNGDWDIAHINTDWITEAYSTSAIEDLSPYLTTESPENYPDGWSDSLLEMQEFDGQIVGLPFHDGPECLIYRKDLFEDPVEKSAYQLRFGKELLPPKTWDEFINIAEFFQRPEKGLYGTVFATFPDGHNSVFDFCLQVWTRGGEIVGANGNVCVDTPAAIEGLQFYRDIVKNAALVHPKCADFESVRAGMSFARGEVAMMVNWFGFASMCEVDPTSKVKGKVDITDIPHGLAGGGTSLNVYWMYAIGSGSRHKDLAYDFIRFAINSKNDKLLTLEGGIGCRISTWNDAEVNEVVPYYSRLKDLHENSRTLPRHLNWAKAAVVIDQAVLRAINSDVPTEAILKEAQNQMNKIF